MEEWGAAAPAALHICRITLAACCIGDITASVTLHWAASQANSSPLPSPSLLHPPSALLNSPHFLFHISSESGCCFCLPLTPYFPFLSHLALNPRSPSDSLAGERLLCLDPLHNQTQLAAAAAAAFCLWAKVFFFLRVPVCPVCVRLFLLLPSSRVGIVCAARPRCLGAFWQGELFVFFAPLLLSFCCPQPRNPLGSACQERRWLGEESLGCQLARSPLPSFLLLSV